MAPSIGAVELPQLGLFDQKGNNLLSEDTRGDVLISKQVLLANLQGAGFDAQLVDLKNGDQQEEYGQVRWRNTGLTKVYYGRRISSLDSSEYDAWAVTNNFSQYREVACMTVKHLAGKGRPVVIGGSDAIAAPHVYLAAGASAVVLDKSGAANAPIMDYVLGRTPREELAGVILAENDTVIQPPPRIRRALSPQDWPLPTLSVAEQCSGNGYKDLPLPEKPTVVGSIFTDIGCDRKCDFCQTPTYRLGYRPMSPERVSQWLAVQKEIGAKVIVNVADQFLGRVLKKGGREEVLEIMKNIREQGFSIVWPNGLEFKKTTLGRGIERKEGTDFTPDEEIIQALWGWDGKVGCHFAYLPAERPVVGREDYAKLLPWKQHCEIMKAIARTGIPYVRYGVIIGFPDDSDETILHLEEAISELYEELTAINPSLGFQVAPFSISPIPGTPQAEKIRNSGLIRIDDPSMFGSVWTPVVDTHHLSYGEVADWQMRLTKIGSRYIQDGSSRT